MEYVHERFRCRRRKIVAFSLMLLVEDDEREVKRGKTRLWIKRRQERGYFANIVQELTIEDVAGYREMRHFPPCLQIRFLKKQIELLRMPRRNIVARAWPNDYNTRQHAQMLHEKFDHFQI